MKKRLILLVAFVSGFHILLSQVSELRNKIDKPDVDAIYPGGVEGLYKFIATNIVYPTMARANNVQGKLFVEFIVSSEGYIDPNSVNTLISLDRSCDKEAERVLKSNHIKWTAAIKDGQPVQQKFVIPVVFRFIDFGFTVSENPNQLKSPIRAAVKAKTDKSSSFGWDVYGDTDLKSKIIRLLPGDSVDVIGWAPWLYVISQGSIRGFISYKSLHVSKELSELADRIEKNSFQMEELMRMQDSIKKAQDYQVWAALVNLAKLKSNDERKKRVADSVELLNSPDVFLRITASNKNIYVGECSVVSLALYVSDSNKIPFQFHDLGQQISTLTLGELRKDHCWIASNRIVTILGTEMKTAGPSYTVYEIYKSSYCPRSSESINFQPISISLAQMKISSHKEIEKMINFSTKPLKINVKPASNQTAIFNNNSLVGDFVVSDSISQREVETGKNVIYSLTIKGQGLTFPIMPPMWKQEGMTASQVNQEDADTVLNETYFSAKTFKYSLVFSKAGSYDLSNSTIASYLNPRLNTVNPLLSGPKISVTAGGPVSDKILELSPVENLIALDISQSMMIEDYEPTRMLSAISGLREYLVLKKSCNIGVVVFAGNAKLINVSNKDSCYSRAAINKIDHNLISKRGTAIGDVIWLAISSVTKSQAPKKLVIIGDGDNTAGFLPPTAAIELAKKANLKIYTIGLGNKGLVPFGKDSFGNSNMVENTFSDVDFKKISTMTGGRYYWAKNSEAITTILKQIFQQ